MVEIGSKDVSRAAIHMALSESRSEEQDLKDDYARQAIRTAAVDIGGDFATKLTKFVESSLVAAKREGLIERRHREEGALAGAAHEALIQLQQKAMGMSVGGKIGLARSGEHVCVAVFASIGMLYLNETAVSVAHRSL